MNPDPGKDIPDYSYLLTRTSWLLSFPYRTVSNECGERGHGQLSDHEVAVVIDGSSSKCGAHRFRLLLGLSEPGLPRDDAR